MILLGLSCDYHDAAAALIIDGVVVAASEQERFSRIKHDNSLPIDAMASCLAIAEVAVGEIDAVVFHEKPILTLNRVIAARQRRGPAALASFARETPVLIRRNLMIADRIERWFAESGRRRPPPICYSEHHLSHAAAAFYPSPFETSAVLTIDGIGEWATSTIGRGLHHRLDLVEEQRFPHSVGLLYSLVTAWCGFTPNDGEYKLMGLAPFGEPRFAAALAEIAELHDDGSLAVSGRSVRWWSGSPSRMHRLVRLFDGPPRTSDAPMSQRECDLARSAQLFIESTLLAMATHARDVTGEDHLCLAGGVALNCVANGRLLREGPFSEIWVQPAAGDAGSAIGSALWYWHEELGNSRPRPESRSNSRAGGDRMLGAALGPSFASSEVRAWLDGIGIAYRHVPDLAERSELVAGRLAKGDIVGHFEGRMEFGPRALGHRSILADPRSATMQQELNLRVKGRESFRPFAPAVLWEHASEWFDIDRPSPYMLFTFDVAASHRLTIDEEPVEPHDRVRVRRSDIPACTHIDGSARVQTVHADTSPVFHALISAFAAATGCPVLLNTSFNVANEPIVCYPEDALDVAVQAGLDVLVIEDCVIELHRSASVPGVSKDEG